MKLKFLTFVLLILITFSSCGIFQTNSEKSDYNPSNSNEYNESINTSIEESKNSSQPNLTQEQAQELIPQICESVNLYYKILRRNIEVDENNGIEIEHKYYSQTISDYESYMVEGYYPIIDERFNTKEKIEDFLNKNFINYYSFMDDWQDDPDESSFLYYMEKDGFLYIKDYSNIQYTTYKPEDITVTINSEHLLQFDFYSEGIILDSSGNHSMYKDISNTGIYYYENSVWKLDVSNFRRY